MSKITEKIGEETQFQLLRKTVENIAQELAPLYEGRVVVREHGEFIDTPETSMDAFLEIEEQTPGKFLGIFPVTKRRRIFAVEEGFYGEALGKKNMSAYLETSNKAEAVVKKHLDQYVEEHGITKVRMQRGL